MITEVTAAFSSIKAALDIAKGAGALKTETDVNEAIVTIQRGLLEAQGASFEARREIDRLTGRISELEKELERHQRWERESSRYRLEESPFGSFTYVLKPDAANGEPIHRLCVTCFNEGRKSVLHTVTKGRGGETVMCQKCDKSLRLSRATEEVHVVTTSRLRGY
jgi:hypothetical protein